MAEQVMQSIKIHRTETIQRYDTLTATERRIAEWTARGLSAKDILATLSNEDNRERSLKTVSAHRRNLYRKMGVHNAVQLVHALIACGAIRLERIA